MQEGEKLIHDIAHRHGLSEKEAHILQHLDAATDLYKGLPGEYAKDPDGWLAHREALRRLLMVRVVRRDYPEGWLSEAEEGYRKLAHEE